MITKNIDHQIQSQKNIYNRNELSHTSNDPYKEIAKNMDKAYIKLMLEKMRSAVEKDEKDSSELNYYNSILDDEYADLIAIKNDGKGLQETILKQIHPRYQNGRYFNANYVANELANSHPENGYYPTQKENINSHQASKIYERMSPK